MDASLLNLVVFLPLLGAGLLAIVPREQSKLLRYGVLGAAVLNLALSIALAMAFRFDHNGEFQFLTDVPWITQLNIRYKTGVDGISLVMVLLTTLLSAVAILSTFSAVQERLKEFYIWLLVLETGMLGVFVSLDLILFYVFWEAMLIPMYFLIGVWGGPRRMYATIKFVLYTLVGSLLMLVAIVWIYVATSRGEGGGTFDLLALTHPETGIASISTLTSTTRMLLFLCFAAAFAIKVPMFPFHTWLPDAHVEAPTAGSVILAGVLLKMGTYGFVRFCIPLFPEASIQAAPWILLLSVIGIIYGALVAYVQQDVKRLVAYSSVSHLGFCMLGLFAFTRESVNGSILQMINHGLSTGALFLIVGMIYERRHTRDLSAFGGLWRVIPVFATFFLISMLSSAGLPGLNGFVGEFLILIGTWSPEGSQLTRYAGAIGAVGVVLGAVYLLWMFQRMMQGPLDNAENRGLKDLNAREVLTLLPLIIPMFVIGIMPTPFLRMFDQAVYRTVLQPVQSVQRTETGPTIDAPLPPGQLPGGPMTPEQFPGGTMTPEQFRSIPGHESLDPSGGLPGQAAPDGISPPPGLPPGAFAPPPGPAAPPEGGATPPAPGGPGLPSPAVPGAP